MRKIIIFFLIILMCVIVDVRAEEKKLVAITFDDGPNTYNTLEILDLLEQYNAKATFFLIGNNITDENKYVVEREYNIGCEIASHSTSHISMTEMTAEEIRAEIEYTDNLIYSIIGEKPKFFRAPFLNVNDTMYENIDKIFIDGYSSGDSNSNNSAQTRIDNIMANLQDGSIFLMHDFYGNTQTVEALQTLIPSLIADGYEFVTLSELFERKGEVPRKGVVYREVNKYPGYTYTGISNKYSGENVKEFQLDKNELANLNGNYAIKVTFEKNKYPQFVLHRWKSSTDNFYNRYKPTYYNGGVAYYTSQDINNYLNTLNYGYADMSKVLVVSQDSSFIIKGVDLLTNN